LYFICLNFIDFSISILGARNSSTSFDSSYLAFSRSVCFIIFLYWLREPPRLPEEYCLLVYFPPFLTVGEAIVLLL
jgi:hypothetical protein